MKRLFTFLPGLAFLIVLTFATSGPVRAANAADFQAGRIIDDQIFYDKNAYSVGDIQKFLADILDGTANNGANIPCDTAGSKPFYGTYGGVYHGGDVLRKNLDPNFPPPYICVKDYYENPTTHENNLTKADKIAAPIPAGGISAAQIIYNAAQNYSINPKVLIVMIQKESVGPLLTDDWPWYYQYKTVMGYGCPDGAACDAAYYGFYNQVWNAARQFRIYANNPNSYNYAIGLNNIKYNPNTACGTKAVNIQNQATASLYIYTPYTPNQSALNNLYGTGDACGAYGNRNFWRMFTDWFGTTLYDGNDPVGSLDLVQQSPSAIRLAGWGLDRSLTGPATIHVYVDGTWVGAITANAARPDIGAAYPTMGNNHGFDGTVPWTTAGTHQVCAWVVGDNLGAPNYGLGCKSVSINNDSTGSLDLVQATPSAIRLAGWGLDRSLNGPAAVHVYVDGTWAGVITANLARGDVGVHGFDGTVPWTTGGTHQVCAWVVGDNLGAPNSGLGCRTLNINNDPIGSLDVAQQSPSAIRLAGWGLDRSLTGPATIHVYVDGTWVGAITANTSRPDVGTAYPTMGNNHGFDGTVPWTTAGTHQVCAWVVGDSLGAPNAGLGCHSVNINNDPIGSLDLTQVTPGAVRLAGWGLDRSLNGPAAVHVYVDGTWAGVITANLTRGDVGIHGFDGTVPWTAGGTHQVCAWVVGDSLGAPNAGLGCRQFNY